MIDALAPATIPATDEALRHEVRAFLREHLRDRPLEARARSWMGFDAEFSRALAARGWVGLTLPVEYGGGGRSPFARFVLIEELLAAGFSPTAHNGFFRREDFVAAYEQRSGRRVPHWEYYYAYGLFKLAVILQQIYVRWVQGLTIDSRFASLGRSVLALARQGAMTIRA